MKRHQAVEIPADETEGREERFPENPEIRRRINALKDYVKDYDRGDMVTLEEIETLTGLERRCDGWAYHLEKWSREMMRDRGIEIVNVRGEGYILAPVQCQIMDRPQQRFKRAVRQINRGMRSLYRIHNADLSDHQRMIRGKLLTANREAKRSIKTQMKASSVVCAVPETGHSARVAAARAIVERKADAAKQATA